MSSARRWNLAPPEPEPRADGLHPRVEAVARRIHLSGADDRDIPPYRLGVNSGAATAAGMSELQRARGREKAAYLWIRALAVAAIAFVVTTSFQARPGSGRPRPGARRDARGSTVSAAPRSPRCG